MSKIVPLSSERHKLLRLKLGVSFSFAATEALTTLVAQEIPKAAAHLPIAFIAVGEGIQPVAILGLKPGENLFVSSDGRWLASYVPAIYRGYPFLLLQTQDDRVIVALDEENPLFSYTEGRPLFNADGQATDFLSQTIQFLKAVMQSRPVTQRICSLFQKHSLLRPFSISYQAPDKRPQRASGLFQIDEQALSTLSESAFLELRTANALPIIYAHLLSMHQIELLGKFAQQVATKDVPSDLSFLAQSASIDFDKV